MKNNMKTKAELLNEIPIVFREGEKQGRLKAKADMLKEIDGWANSNLNNRKHTNTIENYLGRENIEKLKSKLKEKS